MGRRGRNPTRNWTAALVGLATLLAWTDCATAEEDKTKDEVTT